MTPETLIQPIVALVGLTAVVWLTMVAVRNTAVFRGVASVRYYRAYASDIPPEWVERPARAFNNLLEVPVLFYLLCVLMLVTGHFDRTQVALAWAFVAIRVVHALIHICFNRVPFRFAAYVAGCVTLGVMWVRFAARSL